MEEEHKIYIQELHIKNREIFIDKLWRKEKAHSNACNVFDALINGRENCADCLGENFNSLIVSIRKNFFEDYMPNIDTELSYYFTTYNFWLYTFVERIEFVFNVLNPDKKNEIFQNFYTENFQTLFMIRKWMNFLKHPKEFLFCHWPKYFEDGKIELMEPNNETIIDKKFIQQHYSNPNSRIPKLENNQNVTVLIPNIEELTLNFCDELNSFFKFIAENKIVIDYLKNKTTLDNYYNTNNG